MSDARQAISAPPNELVERLRKYRQDQVLRWWDRLSANERRELVDQLQNLNLQQLQQLYSERDRTYQVPPAERIQPVPIVRLADQAGQWRPHGEQVIARGAVAVLVVAGGQGTRLGVDYPKGMFPIGPVTNKTLFQIHAEKTLVLERRYRGTVPFLVMTSHATHRQTMDFFKEHAYFGLRPEHVHFFQQGTMPALDMATGKLLLEERGRLFTSPNGHGGTLLALAGSGLLKKLRQLGIEQVFYFQVDNPLVKIGDPVFLGHHVAMQAEVSSKIVPKDGPSDKLGNMVVVEGRCCIIEYSDLPDALAQKTDENGRLYLWAGSPAIHLFSLDFLERVTGQGGRMPFHVARKKVPFLNDNGETVHPERENAFKFELFIFDALPLAERWTVVQTSRREEFVPLKNATGPDSPDVVRQAISDLAGDWLDGAGIYVPRRADGSAAFPLEIGPSYALDAEEFARKVDPHLRIHGPTYLS
jgi:UDP-N-acetylglucosamine/UDP-N-acetylgalactosamine diphosphorylase